MEETTSTQFITETMQQVSRSNSVVSLKSLTTLSHGQSMSQVINLHQFARDGDLVRLSESLESETLREKVNELDVKENTPLHYACRYTNLSIVEKLLEMDKISVDREGSDKMTPLHYAARYGKNVTERNVQGTSNPVSNDGVLVVETLVRASADINKRDMYKLTPLHHAALRGNVRIVKCLLSQKGIDIDPVDEQLSTPLSVASTYDNHNSVKLLLKNGADVTRVDYQGQNVLHKAAREGNSKVVNIVIDHLKDDDEKLRTLMRQKDARGNTPFMLAVQSVTSGKTLETFIKRAHSSQYINSPNRRNEFPMHKACRSGDKKTSEILVKHGGNVNVLNNFNESPLYFAVDYSDNVELVQFLVEQGARLDQTTVSGMTPIMAAASQGHIETVMFLADRGASLEWK